MSLPHVHGLLPEQLREHLACHDVVANESETRRLMARTFAPAPRAAGERNPVSRSLRAEVDRLCDTRSSLEIVERVTDPQDQFVKYLMRSPDEALHEAVRIPLLKPNTFSVCLSSQVGCAMGCAFCATGRLGLTRSLAAWEMVQAFLKVRDEAPGRVTGALFQGQGEPLHNYDEVIQAARVLSHPCGGSISASAITISTVGLVPQIRRYAREGHKYRLIVSLTSALAPVRTALLPIAGRIPMSEVIDAIREYAAVTKGRVTVAWVLMSGVNTGADEVDELRRLLGDLKLRINLIDVNDARPDGFRRASDAERKAFMTMLESLRVPIVRRYSGGAGKHAACGMLASLRCGGGEVATP